MSEISDEEIFKLLKSEVLELNYKNEDIFKSFQAPCYTKEHLIKTMESFGINEKCKFLQSDANIEKICDGFLALMQNKCCLEDMAAYCVAACIVYMLQDDADFLSKRTHLLDHSFQISDTLIPMHIHYITKQLYTHLKLNENNFFNLIKLMPRITIASETGKSIVICLAWASIAEICGAQLKMHRFRAFSELINMLENVDTSSFVEQEPLSKVYVLVRMIGFLINIVAFGNNDILIKAGYRDLNLTQRETKLLLEWGQNLNKLIQRKSLKNLDDPKNELYRTISQFLICNVLSLLQSNDSIFGAI